MGIHTKTLMVTGSASVSGTLHFDGVLPSDLTVGSDSAADRTIVFGHTNVKSVIGLDHDSGDANNTVFAINTDASFEATNDLEITQYGDVAIKGDLTVGGNDIKNSEGTTTITLDTDENVTLAQNLTLANNKQYRGIANIKSSYNRNDGTGNFIVQRGSAETNTLVINSSGVITTMPAISTSATIVAPDSAAASLNLKADNSDNAGDDWAIAARTDNTFQIMNDIASAGSLVSQLTVTPNSTASDSVTEVGKLRLAGDVIQANDGEVAITVTTDGDITTRNIKLTGNVINASDGGAAIQLDTDSNVKAIGRLILGGNAITNSDSEICLTTDADQNVGIGTTSPASRLHVKGDLTVEDGSSTDIIGKLYRSGDDGVLDIYNNNTVAARISGAVALSSYVPYDFAVGGALTVTGNTAGYTSTWTGDMTVKSSSSSDVPKITIHSEDTTSGDGGELVFKRYTDSTLEDGVNIGEIWFTASEDNASFQSVAYILCELSEDFAAGSAEGTRLVFATTNNGANSYSEKMRIEDAVYIHGGPEVGANTGGDLVIGASSRGSSHITIDNNEIESFSNETTGETLYLNYNEGGGVIVGTGLFQTAGAATIGTTLSVAGTGNSSIAGKLAIGDESTPSYQLHVEDSTAGYVALFRNTYSSTNSPEVLYLDMENAHASYDSGVFIRGDAGTHGEVLRIRSDGDGTSSILYSFTGTHDCSLKSSPDVIPGMIVETTGKYWVKNTDLEADIASYATCLPYVKLADSDGSKKVFGVLALDMERYISDQHDPAIEKIENENFRKVARGGFRGLVDLNPMDDGYQSAQVMSIGEGCMWVTNINGDIEDGDLIESSVISGYGRLQDDDIMRSRTVAKCTEAIDWDSVSETIEHDGVSYKKYLTTCTFHCG